MIDQFYSLGISLMIAVIVYLTSKVIYGIVTAYLSRQQILTRLAILARLPDTQSSPESVRSWQVPVVNWIKTDSGQRFSELVQQARLNASPLTVASNLVMVMILALLLGWLLLGSIISSLILSAGIYVVANVWLKQKKTKYEERFVEQLPQALSLMSSALSSSASITQAIEHVVRETDPPIKNELLKVIENIGVGMNLDQALDQLHEQLPVTELEIAISAIVIQRRVGGNLVKLLARTSEILKEKIELKKELMVETAQSRLSGKVIGLMPIFVIGFLLIADRNFILPLFTHPLGMIFLSFAVIAEIVGFLLIRRILDIEF